MYHTAIDILTTGKKTAWKPMFLRLVYSQRFRNSPSCNSKQVFDVGLQKCSPTYKNEFMSNDVYLSEVETRNTVSNAHKMIPPAPPCFVWQSPCFTLGNPKIIRIKA